eukprot:765104-Hanusia_phi.AAC.10
MVTCERRSTTGGSGRSGRATGSGGVGRAGPGGGSWAERATHKGMKSKNRDLVEGPCQNGPLLPDLTNVQKSDAKIVMSKSKVADGMSRIFGHPVTQLPCDNGVPAVFEFLCKHVLSEDLNEVAIFRTKPREIEVRP